MPLLNYKRLWVPQIEAGLLDVEAGLAMPALDFRGRKFSSEVKRTTMRKPGRFQVGETLYHFAGLRTKQCTRLGVSFCQRVIPIRISDLPGPYILGRKWLSPAEMEYLARLDTAGKWGREELIHFFASSYGLPVKLDLIIW